ncbi:unnamed protein product [Wuchereria bancrofti]|uniref:poly(A)-specific ribonuclease n=1 Tax=Wuchereria bancrofti TaxID=6293 RepID=A0A3P7FN15_WUCBA|nr:unnamed protein product [Wuchereria bancrofti]
MNDLEVKIHDVWANNLEEEFKRIRDTVKNYPFVAMDTEFPGVVATPLGQFKSKEDFNYQQVSCNVNMLKLIQVGFALLDKEGNMPPTGDVWQFNFQFSLNDDMYSQDSVDLLRNAGIDFGRHQVEGIRMADFGELLTTSGLIVDEHITWLTFHSGYDFGYLMRSILLSELPKEESQFFQYHRKLFPCSYDLKMLLKHPGLVNAKLRGGLQELADQLKVIRKGQQHQAGSDSLLTAQTFFKIKERFFEDTWDQVAPTVEGHLYGLGNTLSSGAPFQMIRIVSLVEALDFTAYVSLFDPESVLKHNVYSLLLYGSIFLLLPTLLVFVGWGSSGNANSFLVESTRDCGKFTGGIPVCEVLLTKMNVKFYGQFLIKYFVALRLITFGIFRPLKNVSFGLFNLSWKCVHWRMPPKFDPSEIKIVYLRCVGGEVGATSALAPKVGPLGLSPKKIGDDIAKATQDWKGLKVTCKLTIQNRVAKIDVVPSAASLLIKELKEPARDRKKVKNGMRQHVMLICN